MKKILVLLVLLVATVAAQNRPKVAVLEYDFSPIGRNVGWWWGTYDIGKGFQALVEDKLLDQGIFRIYSRKFLSKILQEQNFQTSDRADPATAVKIGKLAGVKYIIVGTVTKFEQKRKGGGLGFVTKKLGFGGGGAKITEARVALTTQLIDVETGEILLSVKSEAKDTGIALGAITSVGGGFFGGQNSISKASEKAVDNMVVKLVNKARGLGIIQ